MAGTAADRPKAPEREEKGHFRMKTFSKAILLGAAILAVAASAQACPPGFYYSDASLACVERPDHNDNPGLADPPTADCRDGTVSHSHHHAGSCSSRRCRSLPLRAFVQK
jgi:hypothetical protein